MSFAGLLEIRGTEVTLESPSETSGDATVTWTTVATVQALMEGVSGSEAGVHSEAGFRMLIAYRTDVTSGMRVGMGTRKFAIVSPPVPDMLRRSLTIIAQEIVQ